MKVHDTNKNVMKSKYKLDTTNFNKKWLEKFTSKHFQIIISYLIQSRISYFLEILKLKKQMIKCWTEFPSKVYCDVGLGQVRLSLVSLVDFRIRIQLNKYKNINQHIS